jgi:hypothetical protein
MSATDAAEDVQEKRHAKVRFRMHLKEILHTFCDVLDLSLVTEALGKPPAARTRRIFSH